MSTDTYTQQELTLDTAFTPELLQERTLKIPNHPDDKNWILWTNLGTFTVLSRMTGFGYREIESSWRDTEDTFWLAIGYDVRKSGAKTIAEAIQYIKDNTTFSVRAEDYL